MYVFKDRVVLECLHRTVSAYGRIGEYVRVDATPTRLRLSVANSSSTVLGRAEFPASVFAGPGATRTVLLKARALDLVLRRLEAEELGTVRLRFRTSRAGQEQTEILFVDASGASKQFRINCLDTAVLPLDFADISAEPCTFSCLPAVLKDALASCEASADEVRMQFMPQHITILAKRRGAAAGSGSVLTMGLKTTVKLQPAAFRQLTVLVPWQAEFKLKEFRVVLAFLWQLSEETPVAAAFDTHGPTTPVVFQGYHPSCPELSFVFKFMARVSGGRSADTSTWLRVGAQPEWASSTPQARLAHARTSSLDAARRERAARVRRVTADRSMSPPSVTPTSVTPTSMTPASMIPVSAAASSSITPASLVASSLYESVHTSVDGQRSQRASPAEPGGNSELHSDVHSESRNDARNDVRDAPSNEDLDAAHSDETGNADANELLELGFTQAGPVARGLFD